MGGWGPGGADSYAGRERGASPEAPAATAENRVSQGGGGLPRPPDSLLPKSLLSLCCRRTLLFALRSLPLSLLSCLTSVGSSVDKILFSLCVPGSRSFSVCLCVSLWLCVGTGVSLLCDALCLCFCLWVQPLNFYLLVSLPHSMLGSLL